MLKRLTLVAAALIVALLYPPSALALDAGAVERDLAVTVDGKEENLDLDAAMRRLSVPSVSLAVIEEGRIAFAKAYGGDATPETLYQAASLSKFVTAIGAMRLVEQGMLDLDQDVNAKLTSWRVPANEFDAEHKVTLRGLLSMTGGIGVPGFIGYDPGAPLPTLTQILDGAPPANSPKVTVIAVPGSGFRYSGGGYEIAEALIRDATSKAFPSLMQELVLEPAGMTRSTFAQPLPAVLQAGAASGHYADGRELPGRWRVCPEHAAAGLWSTPTDIAKLLVRLAESWHGFSSLVLRRETLQEVLTRQNGGPYGLGAAIAGDGASLALMKRGQNVGYQGYLILYPATGQGMVVMTGSDNGSTLAASLIARAAKAYGWPDLAQPLPD
jgi:CubicO group peptidase (beta-lactamase class C family)